MRIRSCLPLLVTLALLVVVQPTVAATQSTETSEAALYSRGFDMIMIGRFETGMSERTNEALSQEPAFIEEMFASLDDAEYEELTRREQRAFLELEQDFVAYTTEYQRIDLVVLFTFNETSIIMAMFNDGVEVDVVVDLTNYVIERDRFKRAPDGWDRDFLEDSEI
jgi:hypothetical protein